MKRYLFDLFSMAALMLGLSFQPMAQAQEEEYREIPIQIRINGGQKDFDTSLVSTNLSSYSLVPSSAVTVNNGSSTRNCVVQFSSEVRTTNLDRTDIAYTVDSTSPNACGVFGAERFHIGNSSGTDETGTNISVITLGSGVHTVRPCFRAIDLNGGGATSSLFFRTLTIECKTN